MPTMSNKPVYRVGAAGLDPRDWRLIEIVFKHSQYNKFEFVLSTEIDPASIDLLIANTMQPDGVSAVTQVRAQARVVPVIAAVPRGAPSSARHAISIDRLTLQLLPILNRVVEIELLGPRPSVATAAAQSSARSVSGASPSPAGGAPLPVSNLVPFPGPMPAAIPARPVAAPSASAPTPAPAVPSTSTPSASVDPARGMASPGALSGASTFPEHALHVLIVDDSPTVRRQLTLAFDKMGVVSHPAASAAQAMALLEQTHVDLALVDVVMPETDGYKLTKAIRKLARAKGKILPVIILTSRSSPFDLARGALAGCDAYLAKPVPLQALEAAVHKQLRRALAIDDLAAYLRPLVGSGPAATTSRSPGASSQRAAAPVDASSPALPNPSDSSALPRQGQG